LIEPIDAVKKFIVRTTPGVAGTQQYIQEDLNTSLRISGLSRNTSYKISVEVVYQLVYFPFRTAAKPETEAPAKLLAEFEVTTMAGRPEEKPVSNEAEPLEMLKTKITKHNPGEKFPELGVQYTNVLLIGRPGDGKTSVLQTFITGQRGDSMPAPINSILQGADHVTQSYNW